MAFVDTGPKTILSGKGKIVVTLAGACEKGDVIGYNAGWYAADGNAAVPAYAIAAAPGAAGDVIPAWMEAVVYAAGFGATPGDAVFLSDTVGRITQTPPTTNCQRIGFAASATTLVLNQLAYKPEFSVAMTFPATLGTSGLNEFIAPFPCRLMQASEVHGTAAGAGTLGPYKVADAAAYSAGVALLAASWDATATADTVQAGTLAMSIATRCFLTGDRIMLIAPGGVLTSLANGQVTLQLQRL